jgi:hypothetical protein
LLQIAVSLGLLNVWLLRFNKSTAYRGGIAQNLKDEFLTYGLPTWFMYLIGTFKIGSALALLLGFWAPMLVTPAAGVVVLLMIGAIAMHFKVRDPLMKSIPAALMLSMGITIVLI